MICGSLGEDEWWQQWCLQARERSFRVCTWPVSQSLWIKKYTNNVDIPNWDKMWDTKTSALTQLFSVYGGSYAKRDRCFLALRLCEFYDHGLIDFMGMFVDKNQLIDYTEYITYFKNQTEVDHVAQLYDCYIDSAKKLKRRSEITDYQAIKDDNFSINTMQWHWDQHCVFNVIRESDDSECFGYFTEKTLRCFYHMCLPLPVGYQSAKHIEQLGFWFPHELVNYDYQNCLGYHQRVLGIVDILEKLKNQPDQTKQYFYNNRTNIIDNAKLAIKLLTGPDFT
jgi:hypothetical protein